MIFVKRHLLPEKSASHPGARSSTKLHHSIEMLLPQNEGQRGFSIVEVLLAAVVFGFLVTGLIGAIVYGRASTASAGDRQRALYLAEEGVEATRNIAAAAYSNLVDGSYGVAQVSNQWAFSGTSDTNGIYTRQVVIATAGTNRKSVTSTVTWTASGGSHSVSATTRLVNWPAATKVWTNAIVAGGNDITGTNNGLKTYALGNYAYTVLNVATTNNFVITNISNPAAPTSAVFSITGTPTNIFVVGNYAYVTNQLDTAELQVFDISNPAVTPVLKASVDMIGTGNGQGVYVSGNFAYVVRASDATTNANELTVVNISNPLAPSVVGGYNNNIAMNEVQILGNFAYIATGSTTAEMLVVNVTTPASPTLSATYNPATALVPTSISGFGSTILLGMSTTLDAINVATPTAPVRLGVFTAAGNINDVGVDITNKYAFLGTASTTGEVQVVNIATPASMTLAKTVDVTGTTSTVSGVSYASTLDVLVGATASDTQEVIVVTRN